MTLRGPKEPKEASKKVAGTFTFRIPAHIRQYLESSAMREGRGMTEIIIYALELDRDLGNLLADDHERLTAAAERLGLNPQSEMAKLLAGLVKHGLDKLEADPKKRR